MTGLAQDLRYALRQLRKSPGFTAVAVVTLALGIGANTAIFSVVDAVLLQPLPFQKPDRLVAVRPTEPGRRDDVGVSYPAFLDWRSQNHVFDGLSAFRTDDFTLTGRGDPAHLTGAVVSANLLSVLGVAPVQGRDFLPTEDQPSTNALPVILSNALWRDRFGSDPHVLGESVTLSGQVFTIVAVMPSEFQFPVQGSAVDFWTTIALDSRSTNGNPPMTAQRGVSYLDAIARLRPDASLNQARAEMSTIQDSLNRQYPENRPKAIALVPEIDAVVGDARSGLLMLFAAVGLVLLIACANISNLFWVKASARHKEISARRALGATRLGLMRPLLTESMLIASAGAAAGLVVAFWAVPLLTKLSPEDLPRIAESGLDLKVLAFTAGIGILTSLLFGLAPPLHSGGSDLATVLSEAGRSGTETRGKRRLTEISVVVQTSLAVVLLVGAGLFLRSLVGLAKVDPGFAKDHVITFGLDLPSRYRQKQRVQFYEELLPQIRTLPGVVSASAAFPLPLSADDVKTSFDVEGRPQKESERAVTTLHLIDVNYFRALGIPLLRGREFDAHDDVADATPVVIISQTLAQQAFPGIDPIGRRIRPNISSGPQNAPLRTVVGVVGDVKAEGVAASTIPECYVPYAQLPFAPMSVVVRTVTAPQGIVPTLAKQVQSLDKDLPLLHVKTLDAYVGDSMASTRFETVLLEIFGALAFVLTAVGLYGVVSYTTVQRTREIGIRVALGAEREAIIRMIVRNGVSLACIGIGTGVVAALLVTRLVAGLLYGISASDPLTFLSVITALIVMAMLAGYIPARRAAKVDPMVALRYE